MQFEAGVTAALGDAITGLQDWEPGAREPYHGGTLASRCVQSSNVSF